MLSEYTDHADQGSSHSFKRCHHEATRLGLHTHAFARHFGMCMPVSLSWQQCFDEVQNL